MEYLVIQTALFLSLAMVAGIALGGWGARLIHSNLTANCQNELAGLRRNYEDASKENLLLRTQLRQTETALRKVGVSTSNTDYGDFLATRKALENTRRQYEALLEKLHQQEKSVKHFRAQLQSRQAELEELKQSNALSAGNADQPLVSAGRVSTAPELAASDDLTCIQGVNQPLASKLRALGIMTYRQIAEFTRDDINSIQRIIGAESTLPVDDWIANARSLFQQKYHQPQT
jgi:predicted flap endonuclease-1-like 5' DNA nuclease